MRWVVGLLLLLAALLKSLQLVIEPSGALVYGRWFASPAIGVELALGLFALTGIYWKELRWLAIALFAGFAAYSMHLAIGGAVSCGCFGMIKVHPWWTFALDVAVVFGLLISLPNYQLSICENVVEGGNSSWHQLVTVFILAMSVISIAILGRLANHRTAIAGGVLTMAGELVVLEPEKWVGKKFPLADFVDLDLSSGKWTVLLHRHDCADCQQALSQYEERAAAGERVALIEVPPYGETTAVHSSCHLGRLTDRREWFVQTPVEIHFQDAFVESVVQHDH